MANQKINEIVDIAAFQQLEKLGNLLTINKTAMDELIKAALNMKQTPIAKTYDEAAKAAKAFEAQQTAINKGMIEQEKLEQQLQITIQKQIQTQALLNKEKERSEALARKQAKAAADEASAYKTLSRELDEARLKAKDLATVYGVNDERAKAAAKSVKELDTRLKEIDASVGQHQRNVGNYNGTLDKMKGLLMGAIGGFLSFTAAIKAVQFVIKSTDDATDQFAIRMAGLRGAVGAVARAFATLDFSDLAGKIKTAADAGRDYARVMDEVEDRARGLTVQEQLLKAQMLEQELVWRNRLRTEKERAVALQEYKRLSGVLAAEEIANTNRAIRGELDRARAISGLTDEQIKNFVTASDASQTELEAGKKLIKTYEDLKLAQSNLSAGTSQLGTANVLDAVKGAAGGAAETFKNNLTPAQREAMEMARRYNLVNDEMRDKIAQLMSKQIELANAETEREVATLRASAQIEKAMAKQEAGTRTATKDTLEFASALDVEKESLEPIIQLLVSMGYAADEVIEFQKRMTDAAKQSVKGQFDIRKGGLDEFNKLQREDYMNSLERDRELWAAKKQIAAEGFKNLITLEQSYFDGKRFDIDEEYRLLEKQKDQKLLTEEQYQKQKEQLDAKARKLARDKAISDRILVSAEIIYKYALAQAEMAALAAPTLGQPWVGLLAAMQAIALGAIWAAPLPKLAKGIRNSPEMTAIVGEAGPEFVDTGNRSQWVTRATVMHLPKGSNVIPLKDLADAAGTFRFSPTLDANGKAGYDMSKLIESNQRGDDAIVQAVKSIKTEKEVKIKGLYDSMAWNAYVEQNFRR